MLRSLGLIVLALLLASPALAADVAWKELPGLGQERDHIAPSGRLRAASVRNVNGSLGSKPLSLERCASAYVCVTPDITNNGTFDKTAEVIQCPLGSTAATAPGCKTRWIRDVNNTATKDLNGDESAGKDCIFGLRGPVIFVLWAAIASGTTQADAYCEQSE